MSRSPKPEGPESRSRLPTFLRQRMQEEQARRSASAATSTTTTEIAAPIPPPTRRWNLLKDLLPQLQTRKPYQQSTVAVVPRVMEVPSGSETFSSELGPRLSEPHDNQESMRRCGIIQSYDNVGDYLLKAVESINKAYSALQPTLPEAANRLAKLSIDISSICSDVLASETASPALNLITPCQKPAYPPGLYRNLDEARAAALNQSRAPSLPILPSPAVPLHSVLVPPSPDLPSSPAPPSPPIPQPLPTPTTWASIVATKPAKQDPTTPSPPAPLAPPSPCQAAPATTPTHIRIVHVHNLPPSSTLKTLTSPIKVGALLSVSLSAGSPFRTGTIVFQHSVHAAEFLELNENSVTYTKTSLYGPGIDVVAGGNWPHDSDTIAMSERGGKQRRRLMFVCAGIFARVPREAFKLDVEKVAGKAGVQFIWLFNTGTATVVLASVRLARAVKQAFMAKAAKGGMYAGLTVQYCSDPCERELKLVSQMLEGPEATAGGRRR